MALPDALADEIVRPPVVQRGACGWMATTPPTTSYRIGVCGHTEDEALRLYDEAIDAWRELRSRRLS